MGEECSVFDVSKYHLTISCGEEDVKGFQCSNPCNDLRIEFKIPAGALQ